MRRISWSTESVKCRVKYTSTDKNMLGRNFPDVRTGIFCACSFVIKGRIDSTVAADIPKVLQAVEYIYLDSFLVVAATSVCRNNHQLLTI